MSKIKDVSKLLWNLLATIPVLQEHSKFERMRGCNCSFIIKRGLSLYGWLKWNCELDLEKGMTASACFKETQYPRSLQVASWNNDGTTRMYGCKCFFEIATHFNRNLCKIHGIFAICGCKCSSKKYRIH